MAASPASVLELLLRRLGRVIRQLRIRQEDRPPFRIQDERDLEDLLRAILPIHFDDIRPEIRQTRTQGECTDFVLAPEKIAVASFFVRRSNREDLPDAVQECTDHYEDRLEGGALYCYAFDPAGLIASRPAVESSMSRDGTSLHVRLIIGG